MKYGKLFGTLALSAALLTACGGEEEKAEPAKEEAPTKAAVEPTAAPAEAKPEVIAGDATGYVEEDGYLKYRSAEWSGEAEGLAVNVNSVTLTEDMAIPYPQYEHTKGVPGVMIWVGYENKADTLRSFNVQNAAIVLEDGTEIDCDFNLTGFLFDEVRPGSKRDADVAFLLDPGTDLHAIKSIKFYFGVSKDGNNLEATEVEAPLELTKE